MKALLKFADLVDGLTERVGGLANLIVIIVIVVGFYNVVARFVGRYIGVRLSSNVFIELQWYLFSLIFFFGFAYILKHGVNVRVDFLYTNWSEKQKAWIDFLGTLLFLIPLCIIGIYVTYNPVMTSWGRLPNGKWGTWEVSPDPEGLPRAPIKTMIIIAFVLLLLQSLAQAIKHWAVIQGRTEIADQIKSEVEGIE